MNIFSKKKDLKFVKYVNKKAYKKRLLQFVTGCFIISVAYNMFIAPNDLVPGGVGGIAIIINNLFGINNALTVLILNITLLIISYFLLGKEKTKASILGSILFPIFIILTEYVHVYFQLDTSKLLLNAIFGGMLYGFGAGVVLGTSDNKIFYIVTKKDEEVKEFILKYLNHGVTIFKGKGGYSKNNENVLMAVLPTKDYYRLKEGINEIDKDAFFIVTDSYEVFGGE